VIIICILNKFILEGKTNGSETHSRGSGVDFVFAACEMYPQPSPNKEVTVLLEEDVLLDLA
jgi:hypothetical protein